MVNGEWRVMGKRNEKVQSEERKKENRRLHFYFSIRSRMVGILCLGCPCSSEHKQHSFLSPTATITTMRVTFVLPSEACVRVAFVVGAQLSFPPFFFLSLLSTKCFQSKSVESERLKCGVRLTFRPPTLIYLCYNHVTISVSVCLFIVSLLVCSPKPMQLFSPPPHSPAMNKSSHNLADPLAS